MESLTQYLMNLKSLAYLPKFNEVGALESIVLEDEGYYEVGKKPYDLMEHSLRYYGTNMRAVKDSMKAFTGNMNMAPVAIQALNLCVWFPTKAIKDDTCVWLNSFGVVDCRSINKNMCEVLLLNGHTIELDIPLNKFLKRLMQAYAVMAILYIRLQHMKYNNQHAKKTIHCKPKRNHLGYEVTEE